MIVSIRCPLCFQYFQVQEWDGKKQPFPEHKYNEHHCPLSGEQQPNDVRKWAKKFFPHWHSRDCVAHAFEWGLGTTAHPQLIDLDTFFQSRPVP